MDTSNQIIALQKTGGHLDIGKFIQIFAIIQIMQLRYLQIGAYLWSI